MLGESDQSERRVYNREVSVGDDPVGVFKNIFEELAGSDREGG